jgi:hypothetical protein
LLERIKSIFTGVHGLPPDKIAPTIGLNSMVRPVCFLFAGFMEGWINFIYKDDADVQGQVLPPWNGFLERRIRFRF